VPYETSGSGAKAGADLLGFITQNDFESAVKFLIQKFEACQQDRLSLAVLEDFYMLGFFDLSRIPHK